MLKREPFSNRTAVELCAFLIALASLTACGGSQPTPRVAPGTSWMTPEAQSRDLLYVSSHYQNFVDVYTYPDGKLVGGITVGGYHNDTEGLCSNGQGDVFVTTPYGIYEYPHGQDTPVAILTDPYGGGSACSVDRGSGTVAVAGGALAIFRPEGQNRWHLPRLFTSKYDEFFSCAYDDSGNLYVVGEDPSGHGDDALLFELPKGSSKIVTISLNKTIKQPASLEWDGQTLALDQQENNVIYRIAVSGRNAKQIGSLRLNGATDIFQFWIQDKTIISAAYEGGYYVGLWKYPNGGAILNTIQQSSAYGATVSLAQPR